MKDLRQLAYTVLVHRYGGSSKREFCALELWYMWYIIAQCLADQSIYLMNQKTKTL